MLMIEDNRAIAEMIPEQYGMGVNIKVGKSLFFHYFLNNLHAGKLNFLSEGWLSVDLHRDHHV